VYCCTPKALYSHVGGGGLANWNCYWWINIRWKNSNILPQAVSCPGIWELVWSVCGSHMNPDAQNRIVIDWAASGLITRAGHRLESLSRDFNEPCRDLTWDAAVSHIHKRETLESWYMNLILLTSRNNPHMTTFEFWNVSVFVSEFQRNNVTMFHQRFWKQHWVHVSIFVSCLWQKKNMMKLKIYLV